MVAISVRCVFSLHCGPKLKIDRPVPHKLLARPFSKACLLLPQKPAHVTQLILREDNIGTSEVFLPLKEDPILGYGPENKNKIKNPMQTFASLKSDLDGFNDCTAFVCV